MIVRRIRGCHAAVVPANDVGAALPIALIITFVVLVIVFAVISIGGQDASLARGETRRVEALYMAESGVQRAESWLDALPTTPSGTTEFYPFGMAEVELGDGTYEVRIIPDPLNPSLVHKRFTIVSRGRRGGFAREVEVVVSPDFYSNYLYFTDMEHQPGLGNPLWFSSGDVIDGPMFTNDQISIFGDPVFLGPVYSAYGGPDDPATSHNAAFLYNNGDPINHVESAASNNAPYDNPTFADGYVLGDAAIDYPTSTLAFDMKGLANDGGISIAGNYIIELSRPDELGNPMYGYVSYRKEGKEWNDVEIASMNGVFFVNGSFSVSGVLDGQLTLATNGGVIITDDVTYRASDANGPLDGCDDMLGIIAGSDINVEWNDANSDDCVIHAAMMGLSNSFRAESWNVGDLRGELTVWGSISQCFRGSVGAGYIDADGNYVPETGYTKDYHYDIRMLEFLPPGFYDFMGTGSYKRLSWKEVPVV